MSSEYHDPGDEHCEPNSLHRLYSLSPDYQDVLSSYVGTQTPDWVLKYNRAVGLRLLFATKQSHNDCGDEDDSKDALHTVMSALPPDFDTLDAIADDVFRITGHDDQGVPLYRVDWRRLRDRFSTT